MKKEYVIGVDLGGTKILTALSDLEGNILKRSRVLVGDVKDKDTVVTKIKETIEQVIEETEVDLEQVAGIGLGCPGPLDIEEGLIHHTPNLNLDDVNIKDELSDLNTPIFLENDANAAALGEQWFGSGKGAENMIYITVSTGIGGGVIINGDIYHGTSDGAGEIGHMTLDPNSVVKCGCGNFGCWEALASGTALSRLGQEALKAEEDTMIDDLVDEISEVDGAVVAKAAAKEDEVALELMNTIAERLGTGLASLINIFNPSRIVFGGGVSNSWSLLEDKVWETIEARAMDSLAEKVEIIPAELGSDVGVVGAIAAALAHIKK
ncbi:ROK family protein [Halanaerobacter jeridensis]|uniref:Glucokinase n=1 Tax=Halanaerobacter jeridensis TaxID=706427 RepID=A0A938XXZ8_9FIRM|nr:ROK family protein [Halanaerobacter jeridensis]MBM7557355.1 glucokinase [Halanaerobacter jeridensis]